MKSMKTAFDENKECYCNVCERHYKNYKRFVIHMKKVHYPDKEIEILRKLTLTFNL